MSIDINNNIRVNAGKHIDTRYMNDRVPYTATTQVNSIITAPERYIGLTVNINNVEYWYKNGINDIDLILKTATTTSGSTVNNIFDVTGVTSVTLTINEHIVLVDTSTTGETITLPSSPTEGQVYVIKDRNGNANTNNITIDGNGKNIDGSASATINTNYGALEIVYSTAVVGGGEWYTLSFIN